MRRLLAGLILLAAIPCLGQSAAPLSASSGTLAERTLNATQSGLYYLPTNPPTLTTVTATALATPGSITVTPVLSKVATITTVAGSALVDGDYFTVEYAPGLTVPIEFDLSPGDGTTGGRVPYVFTAGDSADDIRDGLITLLNGAAGTALTASSGGAATVSIVLDTPGATGGTLTENVTDAGFAVAGFANPTAATTVTYKLVAHLADGTATEAGAASSTAASTATLSAANFLRLTWSAVSNAAYYSLWRTVSPTSPATTGKIVANTTALTYDDTGLAGDGVTAPSSNSTGRLVSTALTTGRVALVGTGGQIQDDAGLTYSGTGATFAVSATTMYVSTLYAHPNEAGPTLKLDRLGFRNSGIIGWTSSGTYSNPSHFAFDTSLSRIAPGVVGVGTGATGSVAGTVQAAGFTGPVTALKSATTSVDVAAATAPSAGQVLTATSGTAATWQTPGGVVVVADTTRVLTLAESGYLVTNTGTAAYAEVHLPSASTAYAANAAYTICATVDTVELMVVPISAGSTLRVGSNVVDNTGYFATTSIGSCMTVRAASTTQWIATAIQGTWTPGP